MGRSSRMKAVAADPQRDADHSTDRRRPPVTQRRQRRRRWRPGPTVGSDPAEHPDGQHTVGHHGRASQCVRATAGQADDGHLVDAQRVGDGAQVVGEAGDGVVLVGGRRADARAVHSDQPDAILPRRRCRPRSGSAAGHRGCRATRRRLALRVAELGEADLAVIRDGDVALELGTRQLVAGEWRSHCKSVPCH